jgi:hemolysin activation/secretion protein
MGELLVDDGWLATAELRYAPNPETTLFAFLDAAHGDVYHDPKPTDAARSLRGHGLGLNWGKPGKVGMTMSIAWRGTGPGLTDGGDRNPRLYWSIQKAF